MNLDHPVLGLDGEGYTDRAGRHRYTYVACSSASRLVSELHRPQGIDSADMFDWLLSLPKAAILVGFSVGYDFAKWVEQCAEGAVYSLTHPDLRSGEHGPRAVKWQGYRINKVSRKFSLSLAGVKGSSRTVWDVWAFFQTSFVSALSKWGVGSKSQVARIKRMKDRRGNFTAIGPAERAYCREECRLLAALVRQLIDAHREAGIELPHLYGPGSTASVMLALMGADEHNVAGSDAFMAAVDRAFTAGRFENSAVGPVVGPLFGYDLASAYPYAWCLLPCMKHGRWKRSSARRSARSRAPSGRGTPRP